MEKQIQIGNWFLTFTGKRFFPLAPKVEDVCIEDIAHSLSRICRFGGHCAVFYSVAQHSLLVSRLCPESPLQALMHDATEAYVGDMVRPLKLNMPKYRRIEQRVWVTICEKFGIDPALHPAVKAADNVALMTERRDICAPSNYKWGLEEEFPPADYRIVAAGPPLAEKKFMEEFVHLSGATS